MNIAKQQNLEQAVRDAIDYIINDEHGGDGTTTNPTLRVFGHRPREWQMVAPNACHPNQTVLVDEEGNRFLVTVTMLRPARRRK